MTREECKAMPLIRGLMLVRKPENVRTTPLHTILKVIDVKNSNNPDPLYTNIFYAWVQKDGELSSMENASALAIYDWAEDEEVDFLYHLCVNRLGDFPRKPAEEV
jgi:hypothetical protein